MQSYAKTGYFQGLNNMPTKKQLANLAKGIATRFQTGEKQARIAKKGGIASGKAKRKQKTMKEMLEYLLEKEVVNKSNGEKVSTLEAMMSAVVRKGISGDVESCKFVRSTIGQDPVTKIQEIDPVQILDDTGEEISVEVTVESRHSAKK